jgi:hypothetical protein
MNSDCANGKDFNGATCNFIKACPSGEIRNKNGSCVKGKLSDSEKEAIKNEQKKAFEKCKEDNDFIESKCKFFKKCGPGMTRNMKTLKCVKGKAPINSRLTKLKNQITNMHTSRSIKNRPKILMQLTQMKTKADSSDKTRIQELIDLARKETSQERKKKDEKVSKKSHKIEDITSKDLINMSPKELAEKVKDNIKKELSIIKPSGPIDASAEAKFRKLVGKKMKDLERAMKKKVSLESKVIPRRITTRIAHNKGATRMSKKLRTMGNNYKKVKETFLNSPLKTLEDIVNSGIKDAEKSKTPTASLIDATKPVVKLVGSVAKSISK